MSMHHKVREGHERFARRRVGGAMKDDEAQDKKMIAKAVGEHEAHDHKGKPKTKLRLRRGGNVKGKAPKMRLDKRARGGRMGHKKGGTTVIVQAGGDTLAAKQAGMQEGLKAGAMMGAKAAAGAPKPPMMPPGAPPGPPMGAPPPGPMGPKPMANGPAPFKRGGAINETAGGASGLGRLEKTGEEMIPVKAHKRRKGGRLEHADGGIC